MDNCHSVNHAVSELVKDQCSSFFVKVFFQEMQEIDCYSQSNTLRSEMTEPEGAGRNFQWKIRGKSTVIS